MLHEDVAHAPLPLPQVEDLCMRADGLPVPDMVRSTNSSMGGRVLLVVVVVVYAICLST